jgi:hypothetical protein
MRRSSPDKLSRDCRRVVTSDWYRRLFPTRLSPQRQAVSEFETTAQGCRIAISVGGVLSFTLNRSSRVSIGYARVSTVDQNLALQRDALTEAGCEKIFTEQMSGAVADRPALHDALEFARSGDTLIVWKLDRLARSMKQLIETIENLRVRGIGFRSLTEALDTTTAQGRLVFHMFGALAEFERSLIRERTQAGLAAARRAGRTGGRPP